MKKDIIFMCQFFYPEFVSSALLPFQTADYLAKQGYSVGAICGYPKEYSVEKNKLPSRERYSNIDIFRKHYIQLGRKGFFSRLINYFSFTFSMFLSAPLFRKYKVIVVYSNPPILPIVAVLAKKLFGCKIVFVSYDIYPDIAVESKVLSESSLISKVMVKINKILGANADRVVSLSNDMKNYLISSKRFSQDKISVIHNWPTESFFYSEVIRNQYLNGIQQEYDLIVSYFGNMGTAQDLETIKLVITNEEIQKKKIAFLFAGHGNKKETLKEFISSNNLKQCKVFNYLAGEDFNEALSISSAFIVSLERGVSRLAVPSKTYSYYQAGRPVIAIMGNETDIAKEITYSNAGISVENGEAEKIVNYLLSIYQDKGLLVEQGNNARKLYENKYQKELQVEKYHSLLKNILEG